MNILIAVNNFINKLRSQPKKNKKIILWLVVIIIGVSLLFWRYDYWRKKIKEFNLEPFKEKMTPPFLKEAK